ncbi:hypothetical protein [Vibrio natriegens]|uniref:hypothetical protein n=1 Tax=Vibrio natriegens TaxID=691 RepID=UPI003B5CCA79
MIFDKIKIYSYYNKVPYFVKDILLDLYFYFSLYKRTRSIKSVLLRNSIDIETLRRDRLSKLLISGFGTDFWKKVYLDLNISKYDCIHSPYLVYEKLPIINKCDVKLNNQAFINRDFKKESLIKTSTSGSTGSALTFFETKQAERERWAVWWRYRQSIGIRFFTRCAYFGGKSITTGKKNRFWVGGLISPQLNFSSFHISQENVFFYVKQLNKFKPQWIHGYPSALHLLSKFALDAGLELEFDVKVITIGSESLLDYQKDSIEKFFKNRVFQHYGLAESVANISEDKLGNLRVDEDFSLVDFFPVSGAKDTYKIIGSNFSNLAFPLIKYDTGDVVYSSYDLSIKNTNRRVQRIDGRVEDYLFLPNGIRIGRLAEVFKKYNEIIESQIHQLKDYSIEVRLVVNELIPLALEDELISSICTKLNYELSINIIYVDSIPKTKNGKLRFITTELEL